LFYVIDKYNNYCNSFPHHFIMEEFTTNVVLFSHEFAMNSNASFQFYLFKYYKLNSSYPFNLNTNTDFANNYAWSFW